MTYEEFAEHIHQNGMYETIYKDSEGREILIIEMLDAYDLLKPTAQNFCSRCGKRLGKDINDVHTCTPPQGLENT